MKFVLSILICLLSVTVFGQTSIYPPDSLTSNPSIPIGAVAIPQGRSTSAEARLAYAIYTQIRFPLSARKAGEAGKIVVFGIVDTSGNFFADSVVFYNQETVVFNTEVGKRSIQQDVRIGVAKRISFLDEIYVVESWPEEWKQPKKDLVLEALRVTGLLPAFNPGTINGKKVSSFLEVSVVFKNLGTVNTRSLNQRSTKRKKGKKKKNRP